MITSTDAIILDEICSVNKKPTKVKINTQDRKPKKTTEKCGKTKAKNK